MQPQSKIYVLRSVDLTERGEPGVNLVTSRDLEKLKTYAVEYEADAQRLADDDEEQLAELESRVQWGPGDPDLDITTWWTIDDVRYDIQIIDEI